MKTLIVSLFIFLSVSNVHAAIFSGTFSGTVANISGPGSAPFSNGDVFTLSFEIDTTSHIPLFAGLDIAGATGTFGNTFVDIYDNESGVQDRFSMISALDSPLGIFDGYPNSNLSLEFIGGTEVFSSSSLAQAFYYSDFDSVSGSFDVNGGAYMGDLIITAGAYSPGPLAAAPLPAAMWLFGSGVLVMIGFTSKKSKQLRSGRQNRQSFTHH